ncbi:RimJ/RimL family protein N-acetyltransferase [Friedmanniella endophytica]|uniref:RimJ/RimL family protein N-acetyltransferase n=1 Tax=Microlunatus kandeliicorticis TaxID=1759536 RepID=A0A7W3IVB9_9ACTN|nr:GNAT family N-acetyltransferase [Microlunatus kandeliicorticis]MBA8795934.1 RimJ/RimL family protein N-acetyltransferase [Microlunatus kandeliicorticis]
MCLRPLEVDDVPVLVGWAADDTFRSRAGWSRGPGPELSAFWHGQVATPARDLLRLGVVHAGDLVGYVDLHGRDAHERELGYLIGPSDRWGAGLGTAAAEAGLAYAFDVLAFRAVWAESDDPVSLRILRRLGLTETEPRNATDGFAFRRLRIERPAWAAWCGRDSQQPGDPLS